MADNDDIHIPSPSVFLRRSPPSNDSSSSTANNITANHAPRPSSAEAKKKAKRKSLGDDGMGATGLAIQRDGEGTAPTIAKPKQSKSRNGCLTCKAKRLKCGEEKPACQQCVKRNIECGGYKKDFKWRPFEETNTRINVFKPQQAPPVAAGSRNSSQSASPTADSVSPIVVKTKPQQLPRKEVKRVSPGQVNSTPVDAERVAKAARRKGPVPPPRPDHPFPSSTSPPLHLPLTETTALPVRDKESAHSSGFNLPGRDNSPRSKGGRTGLSPTLTEILFHNDAHDNDFINFPLPHNFTLPLSLHSPLEHPGFSGESPDEDPQHIQQHDFATQAEYFPPSLRDHVSSNEGALNIWRGPVNYLYEQPSFREDSAEMLAYRFDNITCGILSIMDGGQENPWRSLIWPLAQQSPALYNAITSMTAFHSCKDVPSLRLAGHERKQKSIEFIQEGIRDSSMTDHMAIATALALGFAESFDRHITTGNTHIKGAQALVKRAIAEHQQNPLNGAELARLKFLCNAWVYMDVLARLTSFDSDESNDFDNTFFFSIDPPDMVMGTVERGFGIDFGMPIDARLDPLMGCAGTLFPLIGRVANLVRRVCRSTTNSPAMISQAQDLKIALETWDPPAYIERPADPTTTVQDAIQTSMAYCWATLLHLHQAVPELPSASSSDLAQKVLQYLATVSLSSRTVIVHSYPLMAAGCEAKNEEDRQWVMNRWDAMNRRMRIGSIEKCLAVTEEVWKRCDKYEAQPSTERRLVATADLQPVRQRRESGYENEAPGHNGMVFSYVDNEGDARATSSGSASSAGSTNINNMHGDNRRQNRPNQGSNAMRYLDPAYTVRGHCHWIGVMWDWGWEILL